ncbi:ribokinase [Neobacillus mesonae]|uniref:ribokinase n=1 Tax=Neobacillus mesonae TaxID=1193713 RepID=UPI0020411D75|nr:ribokinase [Neobacillus mesonae]MCM3568965.1 ribokinase [Neobacillus mesonae]
MRPKITVIGSLNMDLVVKTIKFPDDGETILGENVEYFSGGKGANQAVAASRLGADVSMIGAVGDDVYGNKLKESLNKDKIDTSSVKSASGETSGLAFIFVSKTENRIVVVPGANFNCTKDDIDLHQDKIRDSDIVLLQMEIPLETVSYAASIAKKFNKTVILNPAPAQKLPDDLLKNVDILTPNETELQLLTNNESKNIDFNDQMDLLLRKGVKYVITTVGAKGVLYKSYQQEMRALPGFDVPVVDTTGAGDSFNGGLAYALGKGVEFTEAILFANKVAALSVCKAGGQPGMPTLDEVKEFDSKLEKLLNKEDIKL